MVRPRQEMLENSETVGPVKTIIHNPRAGLRCKPACASAQVPDVCLPWRALHRVASEGQMDCGIGAMGTSRV